MSREAIQSTSIESLQNPNELVNNVEQVYDNITSSEEENINDTMYGHQMDGIVNESFEQEGGRVSQNVTQSSPSMVSRLISSLKAPCIVLILFIVLNLKIVRTVVLSLLSKLINPENSYIESASVMLRGIICAVLFFIINKIC